LSKRRGEILARRCKALQYFHARIEMSDESLVTAFAQHLVEEGITCRALRFENMRPALTCVHQQPKREGLAGFPAEVANRLRYSVIRQDEVILVKIRDDEPLAVANRGEQRDHIHAHEECGFCAHNCNADPRSKLRREIGISSLSRQPKGPFYRTLGVSPLLRRGGRI